MRVTSLRLTNFRSIVAMAPIELGALNVLIGPNNAGKSSLIRGLYAMQQGVPGLAADVRIGADEALVDLELTDVHNLAPWSASADDIPAARLQIRIGPGGGHDLVLSHIMSGQQTSRGVNALPAAEPNHFVVPYLSKRKAITYAEDVSQHSALQVAPQFTHLAAKLSRLGNRSFPAHEQYYNTCHAVLGFVVTAIPSPGGQRPGVYVSATETIPMEQMGEGIPNIVGLLADLALSRGKLFLLEEPENDLHPAALKALLDLVLESAEHNQFVVSTHSNIVARHLGSAPDSRLYYVTAKRGELPPEAHIEAVPPTPAARLAILRELGYSFSDFDLWDGWLILEESSAERIIRDYLIPFFAPRLARIRTLAAGGNSAVEPTFDDFHRLVRFTHLEEAYKNRAWVLIDGDDEGHKIISRLRQRYGGWKADRFECFDQAHFEMYYPRRFSDRATQALGEADRETRREAKRLLLDDVRAWLDEDEDRARTALAASAATVIKALTDVEAQL
jgi:hypothetical protein